MLLLLLFLLLLLLSAQAVAVDDASATAMLRAFVAHGGCVIDTARCYSVCSAHLDTLPALLPSCMHALCRAAPRCVAHLSAFIQKTPPDTLKPTFKSCQSSILFTMPKIKMVQDGASEEMLGRCLPRPLELQVTAIF